MERILKLNAIKRIGFLLLVAFINVCFVGELFAGNPFSRGTVVLTPNNYHAHYMLGGTTRCVGKNSIIYIAAEDGWGLQSVGDDPYTFKSEICFDFAFVDCFNGTGRGKMINVSDSEHAVEYSCYDMNGNVVCVNTKVINPGCMCRITVVGYNQPVSKIVCKIKY